MDREREVAEVGLADDRGDDRQDKVDNERVDDRSKRKTHDERDRELDDAAPEEEVLELSENGGSFASRSGSSVTLRHRWLSVDLRSALLQGYGRRWETGVCMPATGRAIVFLSDFGYRNEWVGICHAVMNRIAPASPIVDLSHGVPPLDVRGGAVLLVDSLPYLSAEAVLLAIVDPSVGRDRDVAFESNDGRLVVGPDNGLLSPVAAALGGVARAVEITSPDIVLTPISPSFHARDVLAPAAAHLAAGVDLEKLGAALDPATLGRVQDSRADGGAREDRV